MLQCSEINFFDRHEHAFFYNTGSITLNYNNKGIWVLICLSITFCLTYPKLQL